MVDVINCRLQGICTCLLLLTYFRLSHYLLEEEWFVGHYYKEMIYELHL